MRDKFMDVWVTIPESVEPLVVQWVRNNEGQFDVNQPMLRGTVKDELGNEVPFFCIRIVGMVVDDNGSPSEMMEAVFNTWRRGEGNWVSTVCRGRRPCFNPKCSMPAPYERLIDLVSGASNALPVGPEECLN